MEKKIAYTLGSTERLKSRKLIQQVFKQGKAFSIFPLRVVYILEDNLQSSSQLQAGFTVSTKYFKKAVHRNRVKRLLREAYRLNKNELQQSIVATQKLNVFFIYVGNELPAYELINEKTKQALKRLKKIANENTTTTA